MTVDALTEEIIDMVERGLDDETIARVLALKHRLQPPPSTTPAPAPAPAPSDFLQRRHRTDERVVDVVDELIPQAEFSEAASHTEWTIPVDRLMKATRASRFGNQGDGLRPRSHCRSAVLGAFEARGQGRFVRCRLSRFDDVVTVIKVGP